VVNLITLEATGMRGSKIFANYNVIIIIYTELVY
jgi:hypothetical protein